MRTGSLDMPRGGPRTLGAERRLATRRVRRVASITAPPWAWSPILAVIVGLSVLAIAISYSAARAGAEWAEPLWWLAFATLYGPVVMRLASSGSTRNERFGLVVLLGISLLLVKYLRSPLGLTRYDELLHLRTLDDIVQTERLFSTNPLLPISSVYPGLEIVTSAVVQLSGVSYFAAAYAVLAVGKLVLVLAMFLLYEHISRSSRVAALGTALYMANPNFIFFGSSFAYESLALPIAIGVAFFVLRASSDRLPLPAFTAVTALMTIGVAVTHHVTSLALAAVLVLWSVLTFVRASVPRERAYVWIASALALLATAAWSAEAAARLYEYLSPVIGSAVTSVFEILSGADTGREPFVSSRGRVQPLWSRSLALGSALLLTLALPFGLFAVLRAVRRETAPSRAGLLLLLGIAAIGYPASLVFRLSSAAGALASSRSAEFLFVGVGLVTAMGIIALVRGRLAGLGTSLAPTIAVLAVVVFLGGLVVGTSPDSRLPGPYLVVAGERSIETHSLSVASWVDREIEGEQRIVADSSNRPLIGASGPHLALTPSVAGTPVWPLYFSGQVGERQLEVLRTANVDYLVIDRRLATAEPRLPYYIDNGEQYRTQTGRLSAAALGKWDAQAEVGRVYDNGAIQVYDVRGLSDGP